MARIGLDTNVLIRFVVHDDDVQERAAARLFNELASDDVLYVNLIVVLEAVWTLRRMYGYSREQCLGFVELLLEQRSVELDEHEIIGHALLESRESGADFADTLVGEFNRIAGCSLTYTFDIKAARKVPGMELLQ
ncbi:PIN domain-containing protein [Rhizobium sp. LjRoot254]|uniref:PIN domain-containing protein n=1 Tax=Rhizobium sp. LjRoot254 TaxID=3342297 RepID=UPI003ECFAD15